MTYLFPWLFLKLWELIKLMAKVSIATFLKNNGLCLYDKIYIDINHSSHMLSSEVVYKF